MTCRGPSTGTLVKRLATSKLTIRLFSCMIYSLVNSSHEDGGVLNVRISAPTQGLEDPD